MRSILRWTTVSALLTCLAVLALAQTTHPAAQPNDPKVGADVASDVQVKDTPASQSLAQLAKDQEADTKNLNTIFQQARGSLDANSKALNDELAKAKKEMDDKLKEDKHYKPLLDHIADLQKQVTDVGQKAQADYQKSSGPIQQKLQLELAQIQGLIPVVRKENSLPDDATFDMATGKWKLAAKK